MQPQTSDRDRIKGEIFRSHDTLKRIYEQKGKRDGEKLKRESMRECKGYQLYQSLIHKLTRFTGE